MLLKFIRKSIRSLGLFNIFFFSASSIVGSLFIRDLNEETILAKFLSYTVSFEARFFDYRMRTHLDKNFKSKHVALVTIDDESLEKIGTWPIPRGDHARMMNKLKAFGAKVVGLDIMYPEKAPVCGENNPDQVLKEAFENFQSEGNRVFLGYTLTSSAEDEIKGLPMQILDDSYTSAPGFSMYASRIGKYNFPIQEFVDAEVGLASIAMSEDPDGIFRHYPIVLKVIDSELGELYLGSLGLNAYRSYSEDKKISLNPVSDGGQITINGKPLELTDRGEVSIRFFGGLKAFNQISLWDLLNAPDDDPKMKLALGGKIVFVGSTAQGAHDLRPSPIDPKMPGVLMHMNVAEMLSQQNFLKPVNESVKWSLAFLLVGMLVTLVFQRFGSAMLDLFGLVIVVAGCFYADSYYFLSEGYELKLFYCYFCFFASYSWTTFLNFSEASKEKKQIKGTFARYVAPTIVDEMLKDPEKLQVGGFKRDITCLFSDVRDFTSISEGLSAVDLAHSLNMYMGKMTDIVFETKGTLDKYIGDAIVAFWGAPLEIGNHAQYAVEGAIRMMDALPAINEQFHQMGRPEFKVGIGLNSGECNVGNMGSERIFSYTALGDNMNLGARLESLCKHYGAHILISEYTLSRINRDQFKIRPIDRVIVKGKTTPVGVFEVLHSWHPMTLDPEAFNYYLSAFNMFKEKDFTGALNIFNQLLAGMENDKPTKRMHDLCKKYVEHPESVDEYFDVTKMTEK